MNWKRPRVGNLFSVSDDQLVEDYKAPLMENKLGGDGGLVDNSEGGKAGPLLEFELEIQETCENICTKVLAKIKQPWIEEVVEDHKWSGCTSEFQGMIDKSASDIFAKFLVKVKEWRMEAAEEDHNTITSSCAQIEVARHGESDHQSSTRQVELVKDVIAEVFFESNVLLIVR